MHKLFVKKINPNAKVPEVAHIGEDFGYDIFACLDADVTIKPHEQTRIPTGIAVEMEGVLIGPTGYKLGLIAKQSSGLALKRVLDVKSGVVDAGYRNEIQILLYNYGKEAQIIKHHDKIGQLVPVPVFAGEVIVKEELSDSSRGLAGWGSGHTDGK